MPLNRRANFVLVALAAILPILVAMLVHPAFYNGLRHFVFVVPPFAAIGGLAAAWLFERAHSRSARPQPPRSLPSSSAASALPVIDMVRLHPYQYTAFNWASGGVRMAHDNYMLDYWGLAFKQAGEALRAKLDELHLKPPGGRRWTVEICGPQRSGRSGARARVRNHLGSQARGFRDDARHVLLPRPDAPVLVEINREGIDYARVYDIRGRPVPNLLTEPPP